MVLIGSTAYWYKVQQTLDILVRVLTIGLYLPKAIVPLWSGQKTKWAHWSPLPALCPFTTFSSHLKYLTRQGFNSLRMSWISLRTPLIFLVRTLILDAFTDRVIHPSVWSQMKSQTSKPVSWDRGRCEHCHWICMPSFPMSLSSTLVWSTTFHWVWWLGSHAHWTSGGDQVMLCLYLLCSNLKKLFGLTYIYTYPHHNYCSYIWLLPDYHIMFILRVQMGVVYSCSLYHIYLASCCHSLCKSGCPDSIVCEL